MTCFLIHLPPSIIKFSLSQVVYNGQSVFHEKPVFICFPQGVHLHWSTTLPITAAELTEDDNLEIVVSGWGEGRCGPLAIRTCHGSHKFMTSDDL
jgi:hypothetical protein